MIQRLIFTSALMMCCAAAILAQNIGIGTANPTAKLQVVGDLDVRSFTADSAVIQDQSNSTTGVATNFNDAWQSFTAGVNGNLTRIDIHGGTPTGDNVDLKIYAGEGVGGTELATMAAIAWSTTTEWKTYNLPAPVALQTGQVYTWRINDGGGNAIIYYDNANPYAGGRDNFSASEDYDFRTFMNVEVQDTVFTLMADIGRVGIGTATPASSSKLEIFSNSNGILIPRMTAGTRDAITSPATGLLVYVTGSNVFSYYDGTSWVSLGGAVTQLADADADTRILVEKTSDEDTIFFQVGGTENFRMVPGRLEVVNTGNSIIIGEGAGGNDDFSDNKNVYIGRQAGRINSNTTGGNTLVGYQAMYFGNAENTTAIGAKTLFNNIGTLNTAIGYNGLNSNSTGSSNTGIGYQALWYNETGNNSTAAGVSALHWHQGSDNTAMGFQAMYGDLFDAPSNTGSGNTALGNRSLYNNTTGSDNTAVGDSAMLGNTTGRSNTALGHQANVSAADLDSATAIGRAASVNASHKIRLGATSITTIEGPAYTPPSDARFKDNIQADIPGLDFILKLNPVSYNFDRLAFARHIGENTVGREQILQHLSERRTVGFLAQEVEELVLASGFAAFDAVHAPTNETDNYSLSYAHFVVPLVKAMQELSGQYDILETGADVQDDMFEANQAEITALLHRIAALETAPANPVHQWLD